jgi:hypothetical protein
MSHERRQEYLEKQRIARQQKKAATVSDTSGKPRSTGQGWYARMTDEKKAEYLEKLRISRKKKMAALGMNFKEPGSNPPTPGKLYAISEYKWYHCWYHHFILYSSSL